MVTSQAIQPVAQGYAYSLRVRVTGGEPAFPAGCVVRADVRAYVGASKVAGSLSTTDGTLARVDDTTIDFHLSATMTAAIGNDSAVVDFARVDLSPPEWIAVQIKLPVIVPVTVV